MESQLQTPFKDEAVSAHSCNDEGKEDDGRNGMHRASCNCDGTASLRFWKAGRGRPADETKNELRATLRKRRSVSRGAAISGTTPAKKTPQRSVKPKVSSNIKHRNCRKGTSQVRRSEQNRTSNVVKNFALKFMFFGFKLLLAEDSVGNRVSKNVTNLGNPETSNPRNR